MSNAIELWREKLEAYERDLAIAADPAQKFQLKKLIAETKAKIAELEKDASDAGTPSVGQPENVPKIAVSKLFRGKNTGSDILIGRDKELADLDAAWIGSGKKNTITIVAWGGVGKNFLVAHWAAKKLAQPDHGGIERYFDWSFYSQGTRREGDATGASHAASADLFLKEALEFFGDPALAASNAGAWQKGERLAQLVGNRRCLLILDGLEPLQDARTGDLRDDGLRALLRGLAAHNHGLCLVTTRQYLPELATWHQTTAPEWELASLTDEAGDALLTKLGVNGTKTEKRNLSARVKGHALTLTLLGNYLRKAHHGDIRRVDRVDFQKVNEKEQGGHAFRVIAAYERWFQENNCRVELAILRMLGLFDRPATPDCLAALCDPPIPGLTDAIATLTEDDWNEALTHLVELNLVEEQPWEPRRIVGYSEEEAKQVWQVYREKNKYLNLGEANSFQTCPSSFASGNSLDSHPLIRAFFAKRFEENAPTTWRAAHSRLFGHLQASVPYWPEGLDGLQPLYQAVIHGCQAGVYQETLDRVYIARILRDTVGRAYYSSMKLGALSQDLSAVRCFFVAPWGRTAPELAPKDQTWLLNEAASRLRALGRLTEALEPMRASLEINTQKSQWENAASVALNLSGLHLTSGDVVSAIREAGLSVSFADRSGNSFLRIVTRTSEAAATHAAGLGEARHLFEEAEAMQHKWQPDYCLLYSFMGFLFCDLLLADPERVAWRHFLQLETEKSKLETAVASCLSVEQRTAKTLDWAVNHFNFGFGSVAFDHLSLGRAALYHAILARSALRMPQSGIEHIEAAVRGLGQAGTIDDPPRALLTRAWLRALQGQPELARADLDEAQQLAERGPMHLFIADIHLHRARLFFREKPYPWNKDKDGKPRGPKDDLAAARQLIERCGYWRRKEELEDAEEAAKSW